MKIHKHIWGVFAVYLFPNDIYPTAPEIWFIALTLQLYCGNSCFNLIELFTIDPVLIFNYIKKATLPGHRPIKGPSKYNAAWKRYICQVIAIKLITCMNLVYIHLAQKKFSLVQASRLCNFFGQTILCVKGTPTDRICLQLNVLPCFSQDTALIFWHWRCGNNQENCIN